MARKIESLFVPGPAGRLEALLEEPDHTLPLAAALVCHPHPQHGGTMHNKVVYRIARGLRRSGVAVLRFNFRGVNLSEGAYADGEGELDDAQAALGYLRGRYPGLPFVLAGFSFGSRVILRLGCGDTQATRLIAVGFPSMYKDRSNLDACTLPRIFIQSTHDQYGPVAEIEQTVASLPEPKQLILVEAKDHFFDGGLDQLEEAVVEAANW
ncbi:MAG: alpha/beta family hydrolase [Bryobacteraceae bacterium]|jgi:alpha/beta superfamily hydrolase